MRFYLAVITGCLIGVVPSFAQGQDERGGAQDQHLKDFEYFIGSWAVDAKMETDFEPLSDLTQGPLKFVFVYKWMKDKSFVTLDIKEKPKAPVEYHSVIGWDPVKKRIKSRDVNYVGAWFEYVHVKTDDGWVIEGDSVYPEDTTGTFRGEVTIVDSDNFRYEGRGVMKKNGKEIETSLIYEAKRRKPRAE